MKYYFIHTPKFGISLVNPCPIYATFTSEPLFMQDVINHFSARVQLWDPPLISNSSMCSFGINSSPSDDIKCLEFQNEINI